MKKDFIIIGLLFSTFAFSSCDVPSSSLNTKSSRSGDIFVFDIEKQSIEKAVDLFFDLKKPVWSPDGKKIAYGLNSEIWFHDLDTNESSFIGHSDASTPFQWSPDSRSIAYITNPFSNNKTLTIIDIETQESVKELELSSIPFVDNFSWSPNGDLIVVYHFNSVTLTNLEEESQQVIEEPFSVTEVRWAPDGKSFAYIASNFSSGVLVRGLRLFSIEEMEGEFINFLGGNFPVWSPDSKSITLLTFGNEATKIIYRVSTDGSTERLYETSESVNIQLLGYSQDMSSLFLVDRRSGELLMLKEGEEELFRISRDLEGIFEVSASSGLKKLALTFF